MIKILHLALCVALFVTTAGCATIFKGPENSIQVATNPEEAKVYRNGEYLGETPLRLHARGNQDVYLDFKKTGYADNRKMVERTFGVGWFVLDTFTFGLGYIVDAITGAWFGFPDTVAVPLEKK